MARTNIFLDNKLISKVMKLTGAKSKREAVQIALERIVNNAKILEDLRKIKGRLEWEGDLDEMRQSR